MNLIDYSSLVTLDFVREFLPYEFGCKVLDVGCGDGAICVLLKNLGAEPLGIDLDQRHLQDLNSTEIPVWNGHWCDFSPIPVDVVLFNRSLHHMNPEQSIAHAVACLPEGGRIIVEDFANTEVESAEVGWIVEQVGKLFELGVLELNDDSFLNKILKSQDPYSDWHRDHHDVCSANEILEALATVGQLIHSSEFPYLFRYFAKLIGTKGRSNEVLGSLFNKESQLINSKYLKGIGRRWVTKVGNTQN